MTDDQRSTDSTSASPSTDAPEPFNSRRRWRMPAFVCSAVLGIVVALIAAATADPFHGGVDFDRVAVKHNRGKNGWSEVVLPTDDAARLVDLLKTCRVEKSFRRGGRIQQFFNRFRPKIVFPTSLGTQNLVVPLRSGETIHVQIADQEKSIFGIRQKAPSPGPAAKPVDVFIEVFECDCTEPWDGIQTLLNESKGEPR